MDCDDQKTDQDRSHQKPKTEKSQWEKFLDTPLCLHTESHIYCFRLKQLGSEYGNWNPQTYPNDLKRLPPVSTFDFYNEGFPIGMGCFKLGSDWFMIGGERVLKEADIYKYQFVFNEKAITDSVYQGPSTEVFHLNLSSSDTLSLEPSSMTSMIAGKARPIVLPTGGKIYAFHSGSVFNQHHGGIHPSFDPPFEVYDESEKVWRGVEDAPFVSREIGWHCRLPPLYGHFVIGCKLFLKALSRGSGCFDTSSGTWDRCSLFLSNMRSSFGKTHLHFPYHGNCVSALELDCAGFHLMFFTQTFGLEEPPKPFALLIHEDGTLHCYQDLSEELFVDFLPQLSSFVQSRFLDLGNGIVCAIIYGPDYPQSEFLLHICIFEVEVLAADMGSHPKPENKKFLKLNLLKNYFCKMTGVGHHILLGLVDAFFLQDAAAGGD